MNTSDDQAPPRENKASIAGVLTIPELLAIGRAQWPDNDLVVFDDRRLSYREADTASAKLARRLLASGVGKSSRVGVLFPNSAEFVITWLALNRIGAIGVPLSTFSTAPELSQLIRHADLHSLVLTTAFLKHDYIRRLEEAIPSLAEASTRFLPEAPFLRHLWVWSDQPPKWAGSALGGEASEVSPQVLAAAEEQVHPSDVAAIIYTSGSTGEPKGVVHTQGSFLRQSVKQAREKGYNDRDRIFSSMPFFWVGGLSYKLLPAMQAGAAVLGCQSTATADILDFIERERVTMFLGWPHAAQALENDPGFADRKLDSIRGGYLFGALPPEKRPKDPELLCNALGMTETAGPHTAGHLTPLPESLRGSFGPAAPGIEYRVVNWETSEDVTDGELGELLVRGDTLMQGLYKRERHEVFTVDGWYPTRDLVSRREGHLFFHGRLDDVVKIKGANVSPREVEDVLNEIPGIAQSIVTGVSNNGKQQLAAVLVTKPDTTLDLDSVKTQLREKLSAYKVPSVFETLSSDQLPFRSSGKIDRRALVELLKEGPSEG